MSFKSVKVMIRAKDDDYWILGFSFYDWSKIPEGVAGDPVDESYIKLGSTNLKITYRSTREKTDYGDIHILFHEINIINTETNNEIFSFRRNYHTVDSFEWMANEYTESIQRELDDKINRRYCFVCGKKRK